MKNCNFTLVIPSLDPDEKLAATVRSAIEAGIDDIILIDDGSSKVRRHWFTELEALPEVTLLTHEVNRGKGAALKTAFAYFLKNRTDRCGVVTADGDGQHKTADIIACADEMERSGEIVLGCRDFSLENVPPKSRFGNKTTSIVFRIFCGMKLSDTQTGLRAVPSDLIETVMTAAGTRYEYETNMLLLMGQLSLPYREIKIETVYYDENRASHFRPFRDSVRIYGLIVKYAASSIASSCVDLLMFFLLGQFFFHGGSVVDTLLCTVIARIISSSVNFMLNKRMVFGSKSSVAKTAVKYACVAVPITLSSWLIVYLLSALFGNGINQFGRTLVKVPVDILLFLISFRAQRKWVFAEKANQAAMKKA